MEPSTSRLPMQTAPHDALRHGLSSYKEDASFAHPVEAIQAKVCPRLVAAPSLRVSAFVSVDVLA